MRKRAMGFGAVIALVVGTLAGACDSSGGGATCFAPEHGPDGPSCTGFAVGLSCPVGLSPYYSCVCTAMGSTQDWICSPAGATGGSGGSGGSGTGTGTGTADAGSD